MVVKYSRPIAAAVLCVCMSCACAASEASAEEGDKSGEAAEPPVVRLVTPLGVASGEKTTIIIRGLNFENASAVRFPPMEPPVAATIQSHGKADVPNGLDAKQVGDTQVQVELTVPDGFPGSTLPLVIVTPAGDSGPHELFVSAADALKEEQEPNDGFRQAQPIRVSEAVQGTIHQPRNVDVFRLDGQAGQRVHIEVQAGRFGSALDSILTVFDGSARILEVLDDAPGNSDSVLSLRLPADGRYYLSLADAHDRGSPTHVYRLVVRSEQ